MTPSSPTSSPTPTPKAFPENADATDRRWQIVLDRDSAGDGDGRFVYAVSSTGIYCRPSCPSRRPRRDRVQFFMDPVAARAAGFRACRRCDPDSGGPSAAGADARLREVCLAIESRVAAGERPTLAALGREVGWSPGHLQRVFKSRLGVSPRQWGERRRAERLKTSLRRGDPILDSLYAAGFGSTSRVYEDAGGLLGMTPGRWRRGGQGLALRLACVETRLGWLLVAATPRGICHVALGSNRRRLLRALREALPEAEVSGEDDSLHGMLATLAAWIEGERAWPRLPVELRGTAFQFRVWRALREIPEGETRSYAELAADIGRPGAARAVARACAANPAALAIPCHRVVPAAGGAGGYRHGGTRKQALLERERAVQAAPKR